MLSEFRTIVDVGRVEATIDVDSRVMLMGSCFTDNIGSKFVENRLHALVNPFGDIYNPVSAARLLNRVINRNLCTNRELVQHEGLWHHFDFHGQFSNPEKETVCGRINETIEQVSRFLKSADFLLLTFGTSFVYERSDTSQIVANCHKFPSAFFSRYRLEPEEIISLYKELIVSLRVFNPNLKIIFTVSPVRHWKDGAHQNQVSKAALFLAIDKLCEVFEKVWYFPAYEILMDDLRDYRFYDEKMFNPSHAAIEYIWRRFVDALFTVRAQNYLKRIEKVKRARNHRFFHPDPVLQSRFAQKTLQLIDEIESQFPEIVLSSDREYFDKLV
ncbi:GSCFA domain-containing protein [Thermophagus sp. OGC60D27]|uniref:GSCFA domain-containing protein n=1 Tax=Thermophagus sp. OGC60D27 TaxID=3458415 RepID=UPI0040379D38